MIDQLLDQILANTFTQSQALSRLHVLKDLVLVKLFGQKNVPQTTETKKERSPAQATNWIISLGNIYRHFTRENVYKTFESLEQEIKKIQALVVYLPFELPEQSIAEIGSYLRNQYGKRFLLETKTDPTLIAGTALVWKGTYKDYSIRKSIQDNRSLILTTLKEYLSKQGHFDKAANLGEA